MQPENECETQTQTQTKQLPKIKITLNSANERLFSLPIFFCKEKK